MAEKDRGVRLETRLEAVALEIEAEVRFQVSGFRWESKAKRLALAPRRWRRAQLRAGEWRVQRDVNWKQVLLLFRQHRVEPVVGRAALNRSGRKRAVCKKCICLWDNAEGEEGIFVLLVVQKRPRKHNKEVCWSFGLSGVTCKMRIRHRVFLRSKQKWHLANPANPAG